MPAKKKLSRIPAKKTRSNKRSGLRGFFTLKRSVLLVFVVVFAATSSFLLFKSEAATAYRYADEDYEFTTLNKYRTDNGRAALGRNDCATNYARLHAANMGNSNNLHHSNLYSFMNYIRTNCQSGIGYGDSVVAENIFRVDSALSVTHTVSGWIASPGHRNNILNGAFNRSGVGVYEANGSKWSVQVFYICTSNCGTYTPPAVTGHVDFDGNSCRTIRGWALDRSNRKRAVSVHAYFNTVNSKQPGDGVPYGPTKTYRADVNKAYSTTGNHGFSIPVPSKWRGKWFIVRVYGINNNGQANPLIGWKNVTYTC